MIIYSHGGGIVAGSPGELLWEVGRSPETYYAYHPDKPHEKRDRTPVLQPRWIGKDYVRIKSTPSASGGGLHSSPVTHWRSGHWRQQVHGVGRIDRRPQWIQPMLINGPKPS